MTDPDELSPEERSVADLLAEAGGPAPLPADVADRLDTVLAGLIAERATAGADTAPVTPPDSTEAAAIPATRVVELGARRHRRRMRLLAAAAAVIVAGSAGTGWLAVRSGGDDALSAGGSAISGAEGSLDRGDADQGAPEELSGGASSGRKPPPGSIADLGDAVDPTGLRITSEGYSAQVQDLSRSGLLDAPREAPARTERDVTGCRLPEQARSATRILGVRVDGARAVLLVTPAEGGGREVTAYRCVDAVELATTRLRD